MPIESKDKKRYKILPMQKALLWPQVYTLDRKNGKEVNVVGLYIVIRQGDPLTLEKALNKLIETNDSLRLQYRVDWFFRFRQFVNDYEYQSFPFIQVKNREEFDRHLNEFRAMPNMFKGAPIEAQIIRIEEEDSVGIAVRISHMAADGYSLSLFFERFIACYEHFADGKELNIKEYSIIDCFEKEFAYYKTEQARRDSKYWAKMYLTQPHFSFPAGRRAAKMESDYLDFEIDGKLYSDLVRMTRELSVSLPSMMMSIAALTVYHLRKKRNFALHVLLHGRYDLPSRRTIGDLLNMAPVFFNMEPEKNVRDFISDGYLNYMEAVKHCRCSYNLQILYSFKEAILHGFNFILPWFILSPMDIVKDFANPKYEGYVLPENAQSQQFYLYLMDVPKQKLILRLTYQTRRFTREQIEILMAVYQNMMRYITENPESRLATLNPKKPKKEKNKR